jgi:ATP/maltotriose-dependent transcriptional regulator MalT
MPAARFVPVGADTYQPFIDAFIQELNTVPDELALILDDYHVIELDAIHESMAA